MEKLRINEESVLVSPYDLQRHPQNRTPKNIEELADNIDANGLLSPLRISRDKYHGKHLIIAGERRWRAVLYLMGKNPEDHRFDYIPCQLSNAESELDIALEVISDNLNHCQPEASEFRRILADLSEEYESALLTGNIEEKKNCFIKKVLENRKLSDRQIRRFVTITTKAIPEIEQAWSDCLISNQVAEEVATLSPETQKQIYEILTNGGKINSELVSQVKLSKAEATRVLLKELSLDERIKQFDEAEENHNSESKNGKSHKNNLIKRENEPDSTLSQRDKELLIKAKKVRVIKNATAQLKKMPGDLITRDIEDTLEKAINDLKDILDKSRQERREKE